MVPRSLLALALLCVAFSGCADRGSGGDAATLPPALPALPGFAPLALADVPTFSAPLLVDAVRAGGEPVIAVTHEGTLVVMSHPGSTHYHPSEDPAHPGAELVTPASGQSYLWRSEDGGATWRHVGLPMTDLGPRGPAPGISDPELTVMEDNTVCYTDLAALAAAPVACSTDDARTWLLGNPAAGVGPVDRQWLASHGGELYFTGNHFTDRRLLASTDRGLTWERRGDVPCAQDLVARPQDGALVVACGDAIAVSEDAGATWSDARSVPGASGGGQRIMAEPAVDAAGNVWIVWTTGEHGLWAAGTPDLGLTWPWVFDLGAQAALFHGGEGGEGTFVWPWISAGGAGRFAVTWIGTPESVSSDSHAGPWFVYAAHVVGATGAADGGPGAPRVVVSQLTPEPMHVGPICQSGTVCQVTSMRGEDEGDRRLGDFFETTVDAEGYLHAAWANTADQPDDVVAHVQYVRQTGGVRLLAQDELGAWMPTQG